LAAGLQERNRLKRGTAEGQKQGGLGSEMKG
jgi:hypothetical protein